MLHMSNSSLEEIGSASGHGFLGEHLGNGSTHSVTTKTSPTALATGQAAHKTTLLPEDYELGEYDVICGRGSRCFNHIGNKRFRKVVEDRLEQYMGTTCKHEKTSIIIEIVKVIRKQSPNGGFVKKDNESGRFYEVGDFLAREKTSQAFRDASESYKSSNATKKKKRLLESRNGLLQKSASVPSGMGVLTKSGSKRSLRPSMNDRQDSFKFTKNELGRQDSFKSNISSHSHDRYQPPVPAVAEASCESLEEGLPSSCLSHCRPGQLVRSTKTKREDADILKSIELGHASMSKLSNIFDVDWLERSSNRDDDEDDDNDVSEFATGDFSECGGEPLDAERVSGIGGGSTNYGAVNIQWASQSCPNLNDRAAYQKFKNERMSNQNSSFFGDNDASDDPLRQYFLEKDFDPATTITDELFDTLDASAKRAAAANNNNNNNFTLASPLACGRPNLFLARLNQQAQPQPQTVGSSSNMSIRGTNSSIANNTSSKQHNQQQLFNKVKMEISLDEMDTSTRKSGYDTTTSSSSCKDVVMDDCKLFDRLLEFTERCGSSSPHHNPGNDDDVDPDDFTFSLEPKPIPENDPVVITADV